jgi:hypothetical protein
MDVLEENDNFTISDEVIGPAIAVAIGIELILSLMTNGFVLTFTVCHLTTLKEPSFIYLNSLIAANLTMTISFMPFTLISASAGEWIFGITPEQKDATCQFVAFMFAYSVAVIAQHLPLISVDRFLLIVKPLIYKRIMRTWVAVLVVISMWLIAVVLVVAPFIGLGRYGYSPSVGTCLPIWIGETGFVIYFTIIGSFLFLIIIVTSVWTFCFTRKFIQRQRDNVMSSSTLALDDAGSHVYHSRIRNLIGIFGLLLVVYLVCFSPYVIISFVGFIIDFDNIPRPLFTFSFIFFLLNISASPLVQVYFRRDIKSVIDKIVNKFKGNCCRHRLITDNPSSTAATTATVTNTTTTTTSSIPD